MWNPRNKKGEKLEKYCEPIVKWFPILERFKGCFMSSIGVSDRLYCSLQWFGINLFIVFGKSSKFERDVLCTISPWSQGNYVLIFGKIRINKSPKFYWLKHCYKFEWAQSSKLICFFFVILPTSKFFLLLHR
jgi:hypothetical protein